MTCISLLSARGAPGATSTAIALAMNWPQPVLLIEADTSGSSSVLSGYVRGEVGHKFGLLDLAAINREGAITAHSLVNSSAKLPLPGSDRESEVMWIPSLTRPDQAQVMDSVWDAMIPAIKDIQRQGIDVIVDAGRGLCVGGPLPLLLGSDQILLTTQTGVSDTAATRAAALSLTQQVEARNLESDRVLRLLLVGEGMPYTAPQVAKVCGGLPTTVIDHDPLAAGVFSAGKRPGRNFTSGSYARSIGAAVKTLTTPAKEASNVL